MVQGSGLSAQGLGYTDEGSGFSVQSLGFKGVGFGALNGRFKGEGSRGRV